MKTFNLEVSFFLKTLIPFIKVPLENRNAIVVSQIKQIVEQLEHFRVPKYYDDPFLLYHLAEHLMFEFLHENEHIRNQGIFVFERVEKQSLHHPSR